LGAGWRPRGLVDKAFDGADTHAHKLKGQSEKDHQKLIALCGDSTHIGSNPCNTGGNNLSDGGNHISHKKTPTFLPKTRGYIVLWGSTYYRIKRLTKVATKMIIITPVK